MFCEQNTGDAVMYTRKQTKTKCDIVVDEILSMIARGVYKEHEKLPPERYFVEYFGMSRVTIRESFKKLSMLGVVQIRQGEGTFVCKSDLSTLIQPAFTSIILDDLSVSQLYDARMYVESAVCRLASEAVTPEQTGQLDSLLNAMDTEVENRDTDRFSALDIQFHEYLAEIAGNYILTAVYRTIKDIISKYITRSNLSPEVVRVSQSYHHRIVEAIERHDGEEARLLMERHVSIVKDNLIERIQAGEVPAYLK